MPVSASPGNFSNIPSCIVKTSSGSFAYQNSQRKRRAIAGSRIFFTDGPKDLLLKSHPVHVHTVRNPPYNAPLQPREFALRPGETPMLVNREIARKRKSTRGLRGSRESRLHAAQARLPASITSGPRRSFSHFIFARITPRHISDWDLRTIAPLY